MCSCHTKQMDLYEKFYPRGKSILNGVKDDLSHFVFETQQLGIQVQVSTRMARQEASQLVPELRNMLMEAKKKVASHFVKLIGLSHHSATRTAQKTFKKPKTSLLTSSH